jgi:hypothetical protein
MNYKRVFAGAAVLAVVACSSGGDSGTTPTNKAPEIAFTFTPLATPHDIPVDLTITASDPDNDPLTITWTITRGSLVAQNSRKTVMRWTPPGALGVDTVNVRVTDGTVTRKLTEVIKVGYSLPTGSVAPPVFQKSKSPYIVTLNGADPRLTVLEGAQTTIEPGTEIYLNTAGSFLEVLGKLEAQGTAGEPIIFRQNNRTFSCGDANSTRWAGIIAFGDSALVDLEYVELWFPQDGVRLRDNSSALLKDCKVRCSGNAGALIEGNGSLRAIDSSFTDGLGDGIAIAAITSLPDSVRIQGCTLSFNHSSGIRMDLADVTKVVPIYVEYNDIEINDAHGISLAHSVFPRIHFNKFLGNGDSSISSLFLQGGYPDPVNLPELDVTCNFWGGSHASQSAVDNEIHDSLDVSTVHTRVKSCPWLNTDPTDPLTTTPNCSMSCP